MYAVGYGHWVAYVGGLSMHINSQFVSAKTISKLYGICQGGTSVQPVCTVPSTMGCI